MRSTTEVRIRRWTRVAVVASFCLAVFCSSARPTQAQADSVKCAKTCIGLYQKHINGLVKCALKGANKADVSVTQTCAAALLTKNFEKWLKPVAACGGNDCRIVATDAYLPCLTTFVSPGNNAGSMRFWAYSSSLSAGNTPVALEPYFSAAANGCPY